MLIGITGGIGSGKSVVSRVLAVMGYEVYDCDSRARALIDGSTDILAQIAARISDSVVDRDGCLDRRALAAIVFAEEEKLAVLNEITHGAVREDLASWRREREADGKPLFVESAILYQSGIDRMVDEVWEVTAPTDVRIKRVIQRDNVNSEAVVNRIRSQCTDGYDKHQYVSEIVNDGVQAVLPQIVALLPDT